VLVVNEFVYGTLRVNKQKILKINKFNKMENNKEVNTKKQCNIHVVSKFDMQKFKEYVQTYDAKKNGLDNDEIIVKDMLYGIGLCLNKKEFKYADGFKKFKVFLKVFL